MKKFSLSIPKPCHENWNAMTPAERGRHCAACQKTVMDFTGMSDRQLAQFFKQPQGVVCGRFHADQLDRVLEVPCKRLPWLKYFFTIALPAFLLTLKAQGQRAVRHRMTQLQTARPALMGDTVLPQQVSQVRHLLGRVDRNDAITCQPGRTDTVDIVDREIMGMFVKRVVTRYRVSAMETTLPAFAQIPIKVTPVENVSSNSTLSDARQLTNIRLGGVIASVPVVTKPMQTVPLMPARPNNNALSSFLLLPNPAAAGAAIGLNTKSLGSGQYAVEIVSSTGEVLQTQSMEVSSTQSHQTIVLNKLAAGPYFVRLTSRNTGRSFTEILIVQ